ncbi:MAG: SagB/ThcOx family dehydrogenase [Lachnospiraceae bacterium]|nr:SagB/ThcOx family dehydrogenase [Lachnospiraceae bacterium]
MNDSTRYKIMQNREFLKGHGSWDVGAEPTDQQQKFPGTAPVKTPGSSCRISLPTDFADIVRDISFMKLLENRVSRRSYDDRELSLKELAFLLWSTQGIRKFTGENPRITFRTVPSAGSRHPLETYLFINRVEGLPAGLYHYLPDQWELECLDADSDFEEELTRALCGQHFAAAAPVVFVWSAVPYRTEWRYGLKASKYILLDAGHVCENLYLACEAIGCGTCAIGAYDQECLDELLGFLPGPSAETDYECAVYVASVGKIKG